MSRTLAPVFALLVSVALLLLGHGLFGTLLPVRAQIEAFPTPIIGMLGSLYFLGFGIGCVLGPYIIQRAGHIRAFAALAALLVALPLLCVVIVHQTRSRVAAARSAPLGSAV